MLNFCALIFAVAVVGFTTINFFIHTVYVPIITMSTVHHIVGIQYGYDDAFGLVNVVKQTETLYNYFSVSTL